MNHKICFERVVPQHLKPLQDGRFLRYVAGNAPATRLALSRAHQWAPGSEVTCTFLHGSDKQRSLVEEISKEWERYANIKFRYSSARTSDVRIAFQKGMGSWSALGTDATSAYFPLQTVNFGWLEDDTSMEEYRRVVLHEFGHVLGCIHEHQNPAAKLPWNVAAINEHYAGPPNFWSEEQIARNILQRFDAEFIAHSDYDEESIMLYQFQGELFLDGIGTMDNSELSEMDKQMIGIMYPFV